MTACMQLLRGGDVVLFAPHSAEKQSPSGEHESAHKQDGNADSTLDAKPSGKS